ncbi:DUF4331 domain-containing protein [Telluria aromaticivorans]|uniref:DUF4331 domain-containing protein n=1 Tax=Telluria aromaticivorans TaxID=2725995 RepID=A0A7Y2NZX4_9BURK|nr:DUF4331 domain-containing protein [Telluria aromaticivorans]NNG23529.1 DUF4331 domain-containing protein [Telluria aromaticivorans]
MITQLKRRSNFRNAIIAASCPLLAVLSAFPAQASSHREAPFITTQPKIDGTDVYAFNSYENGRSGYVTLIANYQPLQDPYGAPEFFKMDPNAIYEIHVDNNGDAREDLTFQFKFQNVLRSIALPIGNQNVPIAFPAAGQVNAPNSASLNVNERFTLNLIRGDRRSGQAAAVSRFGTGATTFDKPVDNIGTKTLPDYAAYAAQHIYPVTIPGCSTPGRMFVGQRREGFAVNVGTIFDLLNVPLSVITDPSKINAAPNPLADKNITSLALEIHKTCLLSTRTSDPVIGVWTTASVRQSQLVNPNPPAGYQTTISYGGAYVQVSRLGMPLVNEVVIGLRDKDRFNSSLPQNDGQFAAYVTNPTLPRVVEIALGLTPGSAAPANLPRQDLVTAFLTGIAGVNRPMTVTPSEMMRLNTSIPAVPFPQQNRLGIIGNVLAGGTDNAGYPNGRRPKDDVVDISLVVAMGGLCVANGNNNAFGFGADCNPGKVPLGATAFKLHDAVDQAVQPFLGGFPYLNTPLPGAQ